MRPVHATSHKLQYSCWVLAGLTPLDFQEAGDTAGASLAESAYATLIMRDMRPQNGMSDWTKLCLGYMMEYHTTHLRPKSEAAKSAFDNISEKLVRLSTSAFKTAQVLSQQNVSESQQLLSTEEKRIPVAAVMTAATGEINTEDLVPLPLYARLMLGEDVEEIQWPIEKIYTKFRELDDQLSTGDDLAYDFDFQSKRRALRLLRRSFAAVIVDRETPLGISKDIPGSLPLSHFNELLCSMYTLRRSKNPVVQLKEIGILFSYLDTFADSENRINIIWHVCNLIQKYAADLKVWKMKKTPRNEKGQVGNIQSLLDELNQAVADFPKPAGAGQVSKSPSSRGCAAWRAILAEKILCCFPYFHERYIAFMDKNDLLVQKAREYLANKAK